MTYKNISLEAQWNQGDFLLGVHNFDSTCDHCDAVHNITRIGFGVFEIFIKIDRMP